jgi:hypothetical protein
MNKADYSVTAGIMELPDGHCFEVGTHEWWEWVSSNEAESFRFECDHGVKGYRARKESIKSRSGSFWYAYKRIDRKLRKRYLGKSDELTLERLESVAYDLAKSTEAKEPEPRLPNKSVGNLDTSPQDELRELKHRCMYLENENKRLERLGQDYNQATVAKLSEKHTKALKEVQHWKESSDSYRRQAAKLRAELDELHNTLGNQQSLKLDGIKIYKLHGQEVVRVEDLRRIHSSISSP